MGHVLLACEDAISHGQPFTRFLKKIRNIPEVEPHLSEAVVDRLKSFGSGKFLNGLRGLVLIPSPRPSPGGRGSVAYSAPNLLRAAMVRFKP